MRTFQGKKEAIANELKSKGVALVEMDVTNEDSVNAVLKSAIELMNGLDTIFNNAGIGANVILECFTTNAFRKCLT